MFIKGVIIAIFFLPSCLYAIDLYGLVKSLKYSKTLQDYVSVLKKMQTPDSIIAKYSQTNWAGVEEKIGPQKSLPLFTKNHFKRAEIFLVNLDEDTSAEYVSQVIFATGDQKTDYKIYFIYINDDT